MINHDTSTQSEGQFDTRSRRGAKSPHAETSSNLDGVRASSGAKFRKGDVLDLTSVILARWETGNDAGIRAVTLEPDEKLAVAIGRDVMLKLGNLHNPVTNDAAGALKPVRPSDALNELRLGDRGLCREYMGDDPRQRLIVFWLVETCGVDRGLQV